MNQLRIVLKSFCICAVLHVAALGQQPAFPPKATLDDVRHAIAAGKHVHPRLLATGDELKGLAESASKDPLKKAIADTIIKQADISRNRRARQARARGQATAHHVASLRSACVDARHRLPSHRQ